MSYIILTRLQGRALRRQSINRWYIIEPVELKDGRYAIPKDAVDNIINLLDKDVTVMSRIQQAVNNTQTLDNIDDLLIQYDENGNPTNIVK